MTTAKPTDPIQNIEEKDINAVIVYCTKLGFSKREVHDLLLMAAVVVCDADEYNIGRLAHLIDTTNDELKTLIN